MLGASRGVTVIAPSSAQRRVSLNGEPEAVSGGLNSQESRAIPVPQVTAMKFDEKIAFGLRP